MGVVIDRFRTEERFEEILGQPPGHVTVVNGLSYSTVAGYNSYFAKHIQRRWASVMLTDIKPIELNEWLKDLPLAGKAKAHVRALFHLLLSAQCCGICSTCSVILSSW